MLCTKNAFLFLSLFLSLLCLFFAYKYTHPQGLEDPAVKDEEEE